MSRSPALLACALLAVLLSSSGCAVAPVAKPAPQSNPGADALLVARQSAERARHSPGRRAAEHWLACARAAHTALARGQDPSAALVLANECSDAWMTGALREQRQWQAGRQHVQGSEVEVEFRQLSPYLGSQLRLVKAADVPMRMYHGIRFVRPGLGVPLAAVSPRCSDQPMCALLPYSGVFRPATAWIESDATADARLVIGNPLRAAPPVDDTLQIPLAEDTSASYAYGMAPSPVARLALWGLLGGDEIGQRAGAYLMEDYDPRKRPLIMLHGLGSSPLAWAQLSNAVWGDPELRRQFQVWHVVYQTDAPLFVTRRRIADYLDAALDTLDPDRDDPARTGIVLIGHSLGGVLARLLCVDSEEALWSAAFTVPPGALPGDPADVAVIEPLLLFKPYPGVSRAIFLAAPHQGSPLATRWYGRLVHAIAGQRTPDMQSLRRIARAHPEAIRDELRVLYQRGSINSISTLQATQPVRRASEKLLPAAGIPYHTIAGRLPGRSPEGDGVVPLSSALIAGAASTLVVESGHDVYANDEAIAEVVRILHEDIAQRGGHTQPAGRR